MSSVVMTFSRARGVAQKLREPLHSVLSHRVHGSRRHLSTSSILYRGMEEDMPKRLDWQEEASIYVHWPYCAKRCTYCNFNKYINNSVDHQRMADSLSKETETLLRMSEVKKVKSIYFGGGTPSMALPSTFGRVIETIAKTTHVPDNVEITMEANPTSTNRNKLSEFKAAGVNRVSLGVQTLHDKALRILGREHSAQDAIKSLEECKTLFPNRTSIDIIFGLPGQTAKGLQHELKMIMPMTDDHVSLYQLTLERGTALHKKVMNRGAVMPSEDGMATMYATAIKVLESYGFYRYEASNFTATETAESEHNKSYWRGEQYIGVGPGAHGRFIPWGAGSSKRQARVQTLEPEAWMLEVEKYGHATKKDTVQTNRQMLEELLMLGLRTKEGLPAKRWNAISSGPTLMDVFGSDTYLTKVLLEEGFIELSVRGLKATHRGLNVVNSITAELLNVLSTYYEQYGATSVSF